MQCLERRERWEEVVQSPQHARRRVTFEEMLPVDSESSMSRFVLHQQAYWPRVSKTFRHTTNRHHQGFVHLRQNRGLDRDRTVDNQNWKACQQVNGVRLAVDHHQVKCERRS